MKDTKEMIFLTLTIRFVKESERMKEFIEKLIGRLEEEKSKGYYDSNSVIGEKNCWNKAIEIINKLAEEYINTSADTSSGWIACSERLPEANKGVLVCTNEGQVDVDYYGEYTKDFIGLKGTEQYAIAWMPLPAPYKEGVRG